MKTLPSAILFDLDGTLLDTAPDLAFALNSLRQKHGYDALPFELIRPVASHGAKGLLALGFGIADTDPQFISLREKFLQIYLQHIAKETALFPGMQDVLDYIEAQEIPWGIVTNKPTHLTEALLARLHLSPTNACLVCGDTLPVRKPSPEPLLLACQILDVDPSQSIYVGDAERDIAAGNNAGMKTLLAMYGYISQEDQPLSWQAGFIIRQPLEIIHLLKHL